MTCECRSKRIVSSRFYDDVHIVRLKCKDCGKVTTREVRLKRGPRETIDMIYKRTSQKYKWLREKFGRVL